MVKTAYRASLLHCLRDPGERADSTAVEYFEDGALLIENGHVAAVGPADALLPTLGSDVVTVDYRGKLIVPGFIDCHVHFPQLDIIASYGEQLLDWLQRYAFPAEMKFADAAVAADMAGVFLDQLLQHGTTTALVFASVHKHSAEALFTAAEARGMRLIAGKVLMDRDCPPALADDPESGYRDSLDLIERWHGRKRLGYAITPRFALTSSDEQLSAAGRLAKEHPDVWVHTHLAENLDEIAAVRKRFSDHAGYLDVYDRVGLVRERSVFAHCVHLADEERQTLASKGSAIAFCPTSNMFLGSGLFDLRSADEMAIRCGLGSDIGAGTTLSLLRTAGEAYKVLHLQKQALPAIRGLYLATLGAARALYLDDKIGNFEVGKEADFVVLDSAASTTTERRCAVANDVEEQLFALQMLSDERHIAATYVAGAKQH